MHRSPALSLDSRFSSDHDVRPSGSGELSPVSSLTTSNEDLVVAGPESQLLENSQKIGSFPSKPNDEENQVGSLEVSGSDGSSKSKTEEVTWRSLPRKSQLAVLTLARLSEPLAERSLAAYMYYQLEWFNPNLSEDRITSQGGILTAAFAGAQFLTAVWWGRAADAAWIGRKRVILIGLLGTFVSCIGIGFSTTFVQALMWRILSGALNGNIGVMRTMISEMIGEKKFQSRAFLLMPMCFNVGVIIGPILGGALADPVASFPNIFGENSVLGGKDGVGWMRSFPYALPNLFSGGFILVGALAVILGLDETHYARKDKVDYGRKAGKWVANWLCRRGKRDQYQYSQLAGQEEESVEMVDQTDINDSTTNRRERRQSIHAFPRSVPAASPPPTSSQPAKPSAHVVNDPALTDPPLSFTRTFSRNVNLILTSHFLLAMHVSTFNSLIFLLLPAETSDNKSARLPFFFTGGLGLPSSKVGLATAIIGVVGLPMQLLLYPKLQAKWGTLRSYKTFLPLSCIAYFALPYLGLLPSLPEKTSSILLWPLLTVILTFQVLSRTFALPSTVILINNSSPHPSSLGTIHGVAQSVSSGARTLGPVVGGWLLGWGLKRNFVGLVWWIMAASVAANWSLLWVVREG